MLQLGPEFATLLTKVKCANHLPDLGQWLAGSPLVGKNPQVRDLLGACQNRGGPIC